MAELVGGVCRLHPADTEDLPDARPGSIECILYQVLYFFPFFTNNRKRFRLGFLNPPPAVPLALVGCCLRHITMFVNVRTGRTLY